MCSLQYQKEKVYSTFVLAESIVNGIHLNMLQGQLMSQLEEDVQNLLSQQDGASLHFSEVNLHLHKILPNL
jgi:hypothetical protein